MQQQHICSVDGWALDTVVALDAHSPGFAGAFFRASAERRQVIAAALAVAAPATPREAALFAEFLSGSRHRDILSRTFGELPTGFRGALRRSGPKPHPRNFYRVLHQIFSDNTHVAAAVRQLDTIDFVRLRVAQRLPRDLCSATLVQLIGDPRMSADVAALVRLFERSGVDRSSLAAAVRRVTTEKALSELWDRWSEKLPFPDHPVPPADHYVPVRTGAELRRLALKFRNCARRYLANVMQREAAFAEFRFRDERGVVHLARRGGQWTLSGIFGFDNEMVSTALRSAATEFLGNHGIDTQSRARGAGGEWEVLRRLSGNHFFAL
jgi:hypothetical protein